MRWHRFLIFMLWLGSCSTPTPISNTPVTNLIVDVYFEYPVISFSAKSYQQIAYVKVKEVHGKPIVGARVEMNYTAQLRFKKSPIVFSATNAKGETQASVPLYDPGGSTKQFVTFVVKLGQQEETKTITFELLP